MNKFVKVLLLKKDTFDNRYVNVTGDTMTGTLTTLGTRKSVAIKSTNYTLTANDEIVVFTSTAIATLPQATGTGQTYRICSEGSGITVTIDGNSTDTIKGNLTQTLSDGEDLIITDYASGKWA